MLTISKDRSSTRGVQHYTASMRWCAETTYKPSIITRTHAPKVIDIKRRDLSSRTRVATKLCAAGTIGAAFLNFLSISRRRSVRKLLYGACVRRMRRPSGGANAERAEPPTADRAHAWASPTTRQRCRPPITGDQHRRRSALRKSRDDPLRARVPIPVADAISTSFHRKQKNLCSPAIRSALPQRGPSATSSSVPC